ncbi:MAG: hypothetical protein E5V71_10150 [Mesorhizobium sp.]|nr:XkdF-like putative serine protease domain-containing protein [Mesorhizobium sp.]TIW42253.1 MAG: hypothetical protein E5V71_10150 [Mesorhizobium sp.]
MTLVWGWALVSTRDGEPYWNEEGYHVPESVMVKAAVEFMTGTREAQVMHDGRRAGTVIHAFPLTSDIAKAMGIAANQTGLMVGVQFDDPAVVDKIEKGELTGFSPAFEAFSIPAGA